METRVGIEATCAQSKQRNQLRLSEAGGDLDGQHHMSLTSDDHPTLVQVKIQHRIQQLTHEGCVSFQGITHTATLATPTD